MGVLSIGPVWRQCMATPRSSQEALCRSARRLQHRTKQQVDRRLAFWHSPGRCEAKKTALVKTLPAPFVFCWVVPRMLDVN